MVSYYEACKQTSNHDANCDGMHCPILSDKAVFTLLETAYSEGYIHRFALPTAYVTETLPHIMFFDQ